MRIKEKFGLITLTTKNKIAGLLTKRLGEAGQIIGVRLLNFRTLQFLF